MGKKDRPMQALDMNRYTVETKVWLNELPISSRGELEV